MSRAKTKRTGTSKTPPVSVAQSALNAVGAVGHVVGDAVASGVETLKDVGALAVEKVSEMLPGGATPKPSSASRKKTSASAVKPKVKVKSASKAPKSAATKTAKTAPKSKSAPKVKAKAVKSPSKVKAKAKAKASP